MEFNLVKNLVEKYFEGESSIQEEQQLRTYFAGSDVHKELTVYTPIFNTFKADSEAKLSENFNTNLQSIIIDDVMVSFFEGETSVEDEQILKAYFNSNEIAEKHKSYIPYFTYTTQEAIPKLSSEFESNFQFKLVDSLMEDYFEGNTSLEDEKTLKNYFFGNKIAERHESYKSLFEFYDSESQLVLNSDFNKKLEARLNEPKVIPINRKKKEEAKVRRMTPAVWRAAAMIALAIGGFWLLDLPNSNPGGTMPVAAASTIDWSKYEPKDAKTALAETKAALALVSRKMKEGEEQTLKGFRKIKAANKAVGIN